VALATLRDPRLFGAVEVRKRPGRTVAKPERRSRRRANPIEPGTRPGLYCERSIHEAHQAAARRIVAGVARLSGGFGDGIRASGLLPRASSAGRSQGVPPTNGCHCCGGPVPHAPGGRPAMPDAQPDLGPGASVRDARHVQRSGSGPRNALLDSRHSRRPVRSPSRRPDFRARHGAGRFTQPFRSARHAASPLLIGERTQAIDALSSPRSPA
jgi:hypothetical protein